MRFSFYPLAFNKGSEFINDFSEKECSFISEHEVSKGALKVNEEEFHVGINKINFLEDSVFVDGLIFCAKRKSGGRVEFLLKNLT